MAKYDITIERRLLSKVVRIPWSGCWIWDSKDQSRYGKIGIGLTQPMAHIVSYEVFKGEIPKKMCVCHTCDIGYCINPDHLFLGTHQDNMLDMKNKKRVRGFKCGTKHPFSATNELEVRQFIDLKEYGFNMAEISRMYGYPPSRLYDIFLGRTWNSVTRLPSSRNN